MQIGIRIHFYKRWNKKQELKNDFGFCERVHLGATREFVRMICRSEYLLQKAARQDYTQAEKLIYGIDAEVLLVENAFMELKRWRGMLHAHYVKRTASFLAPPQIRCLAVWAKIS